MTDRGCNSHPARNNRTQAVQNGVGKIKIDASGVAQAPAMSHERRFAPRNDCWTPGSEAIQPRDKTRTVTRCWNQPVVVSAIHSSFPLHQRAQESLLGCWCNSTKHCRSGRFVIPEEEAFVGVAGVLQVCPWLT